MRKKVSCIVKIDNGKFLKYDHVSNLISFTNFLDKNYSGWRFFNVFDKTTKIQICNFTSKNKPTRKMIQ